MVGLCLQALHRGNLDVGDERVQLLLGVLVLVALAGKADAQAEGDVPVESNE